ncbi:hypothetical protein [Cytobacillus pseudoceanisediminis]
MNWLFNRIYKCLEEIQLNGGTEEIQQELAALQELVTAHQAERATPTKLGHVKAETDADGNLILPEMSASNVTTTNGSNVQMEINSLKSSVSNGKLDVRNAITGKGGTVADADGDGVPTHAELAAGVQGLNTLQTGDPLTIKQAGLLSMPKLAITTRADAQIQSMEKVSNQEYYWDWYYDSTQRAIQKIIWDAPTNKYKIIVGYTIPTTYSGYPWGLTYSPELDRLLEFRGTAFHEINRNDLTIAATITGKNQLFIPKNPNALYVAYTPGSGNQMKAGKVDLSYNTITEFTTAETQVNGEFGLVDNYFIYRMLSGGVYKIARINLTTGEKIIGPNYNISTNQNNFLIDGDILYIIHGQYIYKYDIRTMALISSKDMTGTTAINLTAFMNYEDDPTKLLVMFKSSSGEGTLKLVNKADYAVTELDFGATIGVGTPFKFGASGDSFITMGYVENSNRQFQDNLFKLKYQQ